MDTEIFESMATIITAFVGSWFGTRLGLEKFKRERGFDRRLDWYERMIKILYQASTDLAVAKTFEYDYIKAKEKLESYLKTSKSDRGVDKKEVRVEEPLEVEMEMIQANETAINIWRGFQPKHLAVNNLTYEGSLYARQASFRCLWQATDVLQELADNTGAFNGLAGDNLEKISPTIKALRSAADVLAADIRKQLDLDDLVVHPRDIKQPLKSDLC